MRRQLNINLLIWSLASLVLVTTAVHFVHGYQMHHNASALRRQAERALKLSEYGKAADLLRQYLVYEPNDVGAMAAYAAALDKASNSPSLRFKVYLLLE